MLGVTIHDRLSKANILRYIDQRLDLQQETNILMPPCYLGGQLQTLLQVQSKAATSNLASLVVIPIMFFLYFV